MRVLVAMSGGVDSSVAAALPGRGRPRGRRGDHEAVGRPVRHGVLLGRRRRRRPAGGPAARHRPPRLQLHRRLRPPRGRALRRRPRRRAAPRTRASSATGTSSSTGCWTGPRSSASTRWRPATTPGCGLSRGWHWSPAPGRGPGQGPVLRAAHARPGASWPGSCFPIGELTKAEVRQRAAALGLRTAAKPDSQDVCFISRSGGRQAFLGQRIPLRAGRVVDAAGAVRRRSPGGRAGDRRPAAGPRVARARRRRSRVGEPVPAGRPGRGPVPEGSVPSRRRLAARRRATSSTSTWPVPRSPSVPLRRPAVSRDRGPGPGLGGRGPAEGRGASRCRSAPTAAR